MKHISYKKDLLIIVKHKLTKVMMRKIRITKILAFNFLLYN